MVNRNRQFARLARLSVILALAPALAVLSRNFHALAVPSDNYDGSYNDSGFLSPPTVTESDNDSDNTPAAQTPEVMDPHPELFSVRLKEAFPDPEEAFNAARKTILDNYYNPAITDDALYYAAIKGMLRFISPPHNPEHGKILKPEEFKKFEQTLAGKTVSIGIEGQYSEADSSFTVTEIVPGSPAEGILQPYDRILRIDGKELKGLTDKDVKAMLEGEEFKKVALTVVRDIKVFDVAITRMEYKVPNMKVYRLPNNVALIEIKKMTDTIADEFKTETGKLLKENHGKLIVDLRSNVGGYVQEALEIAELFLPKGSITLRIVSHAPKNQKVVTKDPHQFGAPLVLLVNNNTASSCEILAAALKDHGKAKIIGTRTYGKSQLDRTFELPNKYRLYFTTGSMYAPAGKTWFVNGVQPDIEVQQDINVYNEISKLKPEERLEKDEPLASAYNLLKNLPVGD